jgi:hypothetical protein
MGEQRTFPHCDLRSIWLSAWPLNPPSRAPQLRNPTRARKAVSRPSAKVETYREQTTYVPARWSRLEGIFAMDDERVVIAVLAALMLAGVVGEPYSPVEVYYCPAAQPCTAQEGLPPPLPHGPESDFADIGRSFTTSAVIATGPTGSASVGAGAAAPDFWTAG